MNNTDVPIWLKYSLTLEEWFYFLLFLPTNKTIIIKYLLPCWNRRI